MKTGKEVKVSPFKNIMMNMDLSENIAEKATGQLLSNQNIWIKLLESILILHPENSSRTVALKSLKPWRSDVYFNPGNKTI